jgi:hypothetical protein
MQTVTFKEGEHWIVQGLEHDICAQGISVLEAKSRFNLTVHLEQQEPGGLARIGPAPEKFWKMDRD